MSQPARIERTRKDATPMDVPRMIANDRSCSTLVAIAVALGVAEADEDVVVSDNIVAAAAEVANGALVIDEGVYSDSTEEAEEVVVEGELSEVPDQVP